MKSSGFDIDKTHLNDIDRIGKLILLIMTAFVWCYRVGIYLDQNVKKIKIKSMDAKLKVFSNMDFLILKKCFQTL